MATPQKQPKQKDLAEIVPEAGTVDVAGVPCKVRRINLLELASLLRIVTTGAGPALAALGDSLDDDDFGPQMMGLILLSLPNAVDEMVSFIRLVVVPIDDDDVPDDGTWLVNPDPDSVLDILEVIVEQEKGDWQGLVGKAKRLWTAQIQPLLDQGSRKTG